MRFYAVIIGTEILNKRREDKHFLFLQELLLEYGHELFASFVIKDDVELIKNIFSLIKKDTHSVMFSFGGIGSTPDDLTRKIAADIFTNFPLQTHKHFFEDIIEKFKEKAYPHRIHMADLPRNAELLFNPINNMSGFSLHNRYYFVPGFPSMAHPMIREIIKTHYADSIKKYTATLYAYTSEDTLISTMKKLPTSIELSSLPLFVEGQANVELSISSTNEDEIKYYFSLFIQELQEKKIKYKLR